MSATIVSPALSRRASRPAPARLGRWLSRHRWPLLLAILLLALASAGYRVGWTHLFLTADQRGQWLMNRSHYDEAAQSFLDPLQRGVALFRAGRFKEAAAQFGGLDTPEAAFDQGNALVMLGLYDQAVGRYDRALALKPDWADAQANRELARLRAERMKSQGGEEGSTDIPPDEVVFDKTKTDHQDKTDEVPTEGPDMSDAAIRATWLKRVQTQPADFLRARFAYQLQQPGPSPATPPQPAAGGTESVP